MLSHLKIDMSSESLESNTLLPSYATSPPVRLIPPPTATKLITFHHLRRLVCFGNCESRPSEKSQTSQPSERNRVDQKLKNFELIRT